MTVAGSLNTFAGINAGTANTTGSSNSFFGTNAGTANQTTVNNSFFGTDAGRGNIASSNSFFGRSAGFDNITGTRNSFFGLDAGRLNDPGNDNTFFGYRSGSANTTGSNNTIIGSNANVGSGNLSFAAAIGAGAVVSTNNTLVFGRTLDAVQIPGNLNVVGGIGGNGSGLTNLTAGNLNGVIPLTNGGTGSATQNFVDLSTTQTGIAGNKTFTGTLSGNTVNAATQFNIGGIRVLGGIGEGNLYVGDGAGSSATGVQNTFVGSSAGLQNIGGGGNSFFGHTSGLENTIGAANSFFGGAAGRSNTSGGSNSFFGQVAGSDNTTGSFNSFFGTNAGGSNTGGTLNSFVGLGAGSLNTAGSENSFFGANAGNSNTTGNNNTTIGNNADVASGILSFATAIGADAVVSSSNSLVLGRPGTNVGIGINSPLSRLHIIHSTLLPGSQWGIRIGNPSTGFITGMRVANNGFFEVTNNVTGGEFANFARLDTSGGWTAVSDVRLKQDIYTLSGFLAKTLRLRPVSYSFKSSPEIQQIGFIAQEVEMIFPEFVTSGKSEDEMKTLNYSGLSVIAIGAIQEQQKQIDEQKTEIELLKNQNQNQQIIISKLLRLVCSDSPGAEICKESK